MIETIVMALVAALVAGVGTWFTLTTLVWWPKEDKLLDEIAFQKVIINNVRVDLSDTADELDAYKKRTKKKTKKGAK